MEHYPQLVPLIILIPALGALINYFWGARLGEKVSSGIATAASILAFVVAILLYSYLSGSNYQAAIINPPHATIFAIGAGEQRAVVKNGEIKVATVMSVTLSTDHRAVDGALAAELAQAFKRHIENPMGMLV